MRRNTLCALALTALAAAPLQGQDDGLLATCNAITANQVRVQNLNPLFTENQKNQIVDPVVDEVQFLCSTVATTLSNVQPAIGIGFSGGNPVLGMGGTLGTRFGFMPRISVTARANAALTELPDLFGEFAADLGSPNEEIGPVPTTTVPLLAVQGDLAIGVFNGFSFIPMLGGLGSIDLLGSISMIPVMGDAGLDDAIMSWGAGARVGILKGSLIAPGLSVSGMYRRLGEVQFGNVAAGDPGQFATDLSTLSLRAVLSKGVLAFDFALGAGYDRYTSDPSFNFALQYACPASEPECAAAKADPTQPLVLTMDPALSGDVTTAAWNVFGNVGLSLLLLNLVAEVGYQKAIDVIDPDDVQGRTLTAEDLGDGRLFGSLGLRLTL